MYEGLSTVNTLTKYQMLEDSYILQDFALNIHYCVGKLPFPIEPPTNVKNILS